MHMRHVETGNPNRLEYCSFSGIGGLVVGLMMGGMGWFVLTVPIEDFSRWISDAIGYGLIASGAAAASLRFGVAIDSESKVLVTSFGFLIPLFQRRRTLDIDHVHLTRSEFRHKGVTYITYSIKVNVAGKTLCLGVHTDSVKAWALAQELAEFLGVELQDQSSPFQEGRGFRPLRSEKFASSLPGPG